MNFLLLVLLLPLLLVCSLLLDLVNFVFCAEVMLRRLSLCLKSLDHRCLVDRLTLELADGAIEAMPFEIRHVRSSMDGRVKVINAAAAVWGKRTALVEWRLMMSQER